MPRAHEVVFEVAFDEAAGDKEAAAIDFDSRWPNLPMSVGGPKLMHTIHTEQQTEGPPQIPLILSVSMSMRAFGPAFAVGALAFVLLIAGPVFTGRRRGSYRRDHWRLAEDEHEHAQKHPDLAEPSAWRSARKQRRGHFLQQPPMPIDPVLKTGLRELMGDLQRAGVSSGPPLSFAPRAGRRVVGTPRLVAESSVLAEVS